jgi:hypothetical protein
MKGDKTLLAASETSVPQGMRGFGDILSAVEQRQIRVLLNFGETFPFESPGLNGRFGNLEFQVLTATQRPTKPESGWVLPVPMNLEKSGTVSTIWGTASLNPVQPAASGTKTIPEIIAGIAGMPVSGEPVPDNLPRLRVPTKAVTDQGRAMLRNADCELRTAEFRNPQSEIRNDDEYPFTILAEKPAYDFRGVFCPGLRPLLVAPADAAELGIEDDTSVRIETESGKKASLPARISDRVSSKTLLVNGNCADARALWGMTIDKATGMVTIPPVRGKLWRSE